MSIRTLRAIKLILMLVLLALCAVPLTFLIPAWIILFIVGFVSLVFYAFGVFDP